MIKIGEIRKILCEEKGRLLKEKIEQYFWDSNGILVGKAQRLFYCDCGSMIRTTEQILGRCECGRIACINCGLVCRGRVVCSQCCYVKANNIKEEETAVYCLSCRLRRSIKIGLKALLSLSLKAKSRAIVRR